MNSHLQCVIVMWVQSKIGQKEINKQVNVLWNSAPRKGFLGLEQDHFEIADDVLDKGENDVVGVQDVDVGGGFAQLDASNDGGL